MPFALARQDTTAAFAVLAVACLMLFVSGCKEASSRSDGSNDRGQENPPDAKSIASEAKDALFNRLSSRLSEVMQAQGPVAAIRVCSQEASQIAETVGSEFGVRIGRTSVRRRNPANMPPEWAVEWVEQGNAEPQFKTLSGNRTGALFPIVLQAKCVMCHGPSPQIAEPVREQIAKMYPTDEATGYQEGDLRGWFWVEVDPSSL